MTQFLTAVELSKILRIPKRSIYKFAKDNLIPGAIRIGKHWRFQSSAIEKWVIETSSVPKNLNPDKS